MKKRTRARGLGSVGAMVALFAALGGFGCLCSVGGHARCLGDDDPAFMLAIDDAGDAGDAGRD